ncbi:MAG: hypothetical protein ACK5MQ_11190 [Pikeienuella sp.]
MSAGAGGDGRRALIVRALKIALPAAALAVFAALFVFNGARYDGGISFEGVDLSALDEGLKLTNPRFTGATGRGEPFSVAAEWALPDGPDPERVDLSGVKGEIELESGRMVTLEAVAGVLLPKTRAVTLSGGVRLTTSDGYSLTAAAAAFDPEADEVTASGDVMAESALGRITADEMRARRAPEAEGQSGEDAYIWFENRVKVRIEASAMAPRRGQGGD